MNVSVFMICAALVAFACGAASGAPLFESGSSSWSVALPKGAPRPVRYAAEELTNTIARISGAALRVVEAEAAPARDVIRLVQDGDEEDDSFSVDAASDAVTLRGSSPRAVLFAAYAFLRDVLGARWYWPGETGEFLPRLERVVVPKWSKAYRPAFPLREMSVCGIPGHRHPPTERWFARQFLNSGINSEAVQEDLGFVRITAGHYVSLPSDGSERDRLFAEHPDWFSLLNGRRDAKGLAGCWSSEGFFGFTVTNLVKLIRSRRADIANMFVADIMPRCECAGCTADPDRSARWWNYYARLIDAVRRELPGQHFAGLAYQEYRSVPFVKVRGVEYVEYCHYNRCYFHALGDASCVMNARSMDEFRRWGRQAPLGFYGYELDIFRQPTYLPVWRLLADEMRVFRDMGLVRVKTEYPVDMHKLRGANPPPKSKTCQYVYRLPAYVWATLAFDPGLDADAIVADFCEHVYGAGASAMKSYHGMMASAWGGMKAHVTYFFNSPRNYAEEFLPPDRERRARALLASAAEAAKGDGRAEGEVAFELECLDAWAKAAEEAKRGGVRHELSDVLGDDAFNMAGWLDAKARSGSAQPTRFKVYRGRDALHVLAECTEAEKPSFDRGGTENDKEPFNWEADSVEMFIMPGDGAARQIVVTPAGGVWDAKDGDISWNSGAVVRPSFAEGRWTLSLSLPYASFGGAPKTGDRWKFMIIRNAARDSKFKACGWPVNAHRDFSSAATLLF